MILLELDPNVVKPGWIPLLITIALALVMVLLYRSMRRQFRRVDVNFPDARAAEPPSGGPGEEQPGDTAAPEAVDAPVAGDGRAPLR